MCRLGFVASAWALMGAVVVGVGRMMDAMPRSVSA